MKICIDFDATLVDASHPYSDLKTPLKFLPGAKEGVLALKAAGHLLILWSGRANKALLYDPKLDPLVRAGKKKAPTPEQWESSYKINWERYKQMLVFVEKELPGVFDAIDDGACGKVSADMYLDDRAMRFGFNPTLHLTWDFIRVMYGHTQKTLALKQE